MDLTNNSLIVKRVTSKSAAASSRVPFDISHQQLNELPDASNPAMPSNTLSKEDEQRVLEWNSEQPPSSLSTIPLEISARAECNPDAAAVEGPDGILTFAQLEDASTRFCQDLRNRGVGSGDRVLFCCVKEACSIVSIASILKLGAVAVPIDPSHPPSRQRAVAEAASVKFGLVAPVYLNAFRQQLPFVTAINIPSCASLFVNDQLQSSRLSNSSWDSQSDFPTPPSSLSSSFPIPGPQPTDIAFILFTSGSTGAPKGVLLDHCAICTSASTHALVQCVSPSTRTLQFSAFTFDVSLYDVWSTLIRGGCVVFVPESQCLNDLAGVINSHRITFAALTPALISTISPSQVPGLEVMTVVGEGPTTDLVDTWASELHLVNGYGSAEASTCNPALMTPGRRANWIGRSVGACSWIVDPDNHQKLMPVGEVGELAIEGSTMARGYLDNEEETKSRFISPPPWCPRPTSRMYLTGDLVAYCPESNDGSMICVGRKSDVLKLKGRRIDSGEIECHIRAALTFSILAAVQVVDKDAPRLAAFVCMGTSTSLPESGAQFGDVVVSTMTPDLQNQLQQLRQHLHERLPPYMVPSIYVPLETMPVLTSRKIHRRLLAQFGNDLTTEQLRTFSLALDRTGESPPENQDEDTLASLWASVLRLKAPPFLEDDFFALGGDSIAAIRLVAEARRSQITLTVEDVFLNPNLKQMAGAVRPLHEEDGPGPEHAGLDSAKLMEEAAAACKVSISQVNDLYAATPFQEAMLALSTQNPGSYVRTVLFKLDESADMDLFVQAWRTAYEVFPVLRTRLFQARNGVSYVVVIDEPLAVASFSSSDMPTIFMDSSLPLVKFAMSRPERLFAWVSHHATYDTWSDSLILEAVSRIYRHPTVRAIDLLSNSISAKKFSIHCSKVAKHPETASFWKGRLGNPETLSHYPRPCQNRKTRPDRLLNYSLNIGYHASSGITTANIIRAAWALVVSCYSGAQNVVFGSVTAGRTLAIQDIDRVAAPTLATVPLTFQVHPDQFVLAFLKQVQNDAAHMMSFEQVGIQNLKTMCGSPRAGEYTSLLVIHPDQPDPFARFVESLDDTIQAHDDSIARSEFHSDPITIDCFLKSQGADLCVAYDSVQVSPAQMSHIMPVFELVLSQFCAVASAQKSDMLLRDVSLLPKSHLTTIMDWNASVPPAESSTLHELVDAQARLHPEKVAVVGPDQSCTFADLSRASTRLARSLKAGDKVKPGTCVILCFEKSALAIVSMLAVLKCQAPFLSVPHPAGETGEYPVERIKGVFEKVKAKTILCCRGSDEKFCVNVLGLEPVAANAILHSNGGEDQEQLDPVSPEGIAYIMTTSGSTGYPKCVQVSHRAICTSLLAQAHAMDIGLWTRGYNFSTYTFDTCISDIFLPLVKGGCVVVPSEHDRLNDLAGNIARLHPNFAFLTPTVLGFLDPAQIKCLKTIASTGEALGSPVARRWIAAGVRLLNAYGPAEAAVICTVGEVAKDCSTPTNIGKAIGSAAWITSTSNPDELVPLGCVGEILIEGPILSSGYLGEREKTAAVFLPTTRWLAKSRRFGVYRTGDLGVFNQDGSITYLGRKDSQIKLNGQRIELAEIEHHLTVVVKDRPVAAGVVNRGGKSKIVAFIAREDDVSEGKGPLLLGVTPEFAAEANKILESLAGVLPGYMTPSAFIPVSYMPRSKPSMKTDRRPLQDQANALSDKAFHRYCNLSDEPLETEELEDHERLLLSMWESVLGKKFGSVSREETFLRLGGDSVSAMKLSRFARNKGYRLSVQSIFRKGKLRDMAAEMSRLESKSETQPTPSNEPGRLRSKATKQLQVSADQIEAIYSCSSLQASMFAASMGTADLYVNRSIFRRVASLDTDRFIWAWSTAVAAIPILRTRIFQDDKSHLHQAVLAPAPLKVERYTGTLQAWLAQDRQLIIRPGSALTRYALLQDPEKPETQYFVWVIHHCLYDGPTYDMIISVVNEIYRSGRTSARLSPFSNFIKHVQQNGQGEKTAEFWHKYLENSTCATLPRTRAASNTSSASFSQFESRLEVSEARASSAVLSAALALVLSRYTGTCDLTFGTVRSGRDTELDGIDTILGPAIATVPTRVKWSSTETISSLLGRLQREVADVIPHQQFGLQDIARATGSKACAFDVLLVVQRGQGTSPQLEGHQQTIGPFADFHTHPLNIECVFGDGQPRLIVQYKPSVIAEEEVQLLMWQLDFVSSQLCDGDKDGRTVGEITLLSPQEREKIMVMAGNPVVPVKSTVADFFRGQAIRYPECLAVAGREISFTYAELDKLSDQLSCYLLDTRETAHQEQQHYVGLVFERSPMYVVSMMAVLKTPRTAFVPIDPAWPETRISAVAKQLDMRQVLVSETQCSRISSIAKGLHPIVVTAKTPSHLANIGHQRPLSPALDDVAYVIFTSGTTATPKGVVIEEASLATSLYNRARVMNVSQRTRTLQFASHAFDASFDEILMPLIAGGSVAVPASDELQDDPAGAVRTMGVNFAFLTPTVVHALFTPAAVAGLLESLVLLGERMTDEVMNAWRGAVTLFNGYGPSECTIAATIQHHSAARADLEANNIGRPSGCRVWITSADDHSRLVPLGCVGEICIEGPILARGYFGTTGSASSFIEHGSGFFGTDTIKRLYKTGDLGRMNLDGSITILGRRDSQGKLRGQRLDLGEIESCIKASKEMPEKATVVVEIVKMGAIGQSEASEMLIAFACLHSHSKINLNEPPLLVEPNDTFSASWLRIQHHLKGSLPDYMVPSISVQVSHIPSNLGGKRDGQALRRLMARPMEELAPYLAKQGKETKRPPRNLTEVGLRRLWSRVLGIAEENIALDDDWVKLGGHSLNAVQLASLARSENEKLSMLNARMVLRHPTLHDMAEAVEKAFVAPRFKAVSRDSPRPFSLMGSSASTIRQAAARSVRLDVADVQDILPPTPLQEAMLATSLQKPGSYFNTFAYRLPDQIKVDRLHTALEALVAANDILRARFCLLDEKPTLVVLQPETAFSWEILEARDLQEVQRHTVAAIETGTRLSRFIEVHLTGGGIFLVWILHHACYDKRSMSLMLGQIEHLYYGHPSMSPPPPFSMYVSWCQQLVSEKRGQEFWKLYLSEPAVSRLPFRDVGEPEPNSSLHRSFDCRSHSEQNHGATDATILRAAWALVLSLFCDAPAVCWAITLSGRDGELEVLSDVVGPTLTTVPVRVSIRPDETVEVFLNRMQRDAGEMAEFGQLGVQNIAQLSASARAACRFNTRQVISLMEPNDAGYDRLIGIAPVSEQVLGTERVNQLDCALVIECTIVVGKGKLKHHINASFDDKAISRVEVDAMLDCFELVTKQLQESPGSKTVREVWTAGQDSEPVNLADYHIRKPSTVRWETDVLRNKLSVVSETPHSFQIVSSLRKQPVPRGAIGELRVIAATHTCVDTGYLARISRNEIRILGRKENKRYVDGDIIILEEVEHVVQEYFPGAKVVAEVGLFNAQGREPEPSLVCFIGSQNESIPESLVVKRHQDMLRSSFPPGLIPSALVLLDIPCLPSGQIDRRTLQNLARDLPQSRFLGRVADGMETEPWETDHKMILFQLCADILGLNLDQISPWSTFIGLGGDSMAAIHLASRLRAKDMQLSVTNILRRQPLSSLAAIMVKINDETQTQQHQYAADDGGSAPLCPMQKLFFQLSPDGCNHFNQSLLLRLSGNVTTSMLEQALCSLVAHHDALRACFQPSDKGWQQSFIPGASPILGVCDISTDIQLKKELSRVQQSLDIQKGIVFSAQVLRRSDGDSFLFLVAHHLIIDLFSWRVLVDELQLLLSGKNPIPVDLSWPSFCRLQTQKLAAPDIGANYSGDFLDFWDMRNKPNLFSDMVSNSTVLDEALTRLFLTDSNRALGTEPVEILTSSLLVSFLETFSQERTEAQVFLEGHGRDVLDVEASQTVGWFTTLLPLSLGQYNLANNVDALFQGLRRIKDSRRRTARESILSTARSLSEGDLSLPVEILMNYQGTATWTLRQENDELLTIATDFPDCSDHDISPDMPRIGLFEISAAVEGGRLRLSMQHNRYMREQDRIDDWFRSWKHVLTVGLPALAALDPSPTLADFPLLSSYNYADLHRLGRIELTSRNLSFADVQDILPCSTVQEGILMSQSRGVGEYVVRVAWEVHGAVMSDQLEQAWLAVVQRHDSLRTLFLESNSSFVQLVLKSSRLTKLHRAVLKHGDGWDTTTLLNLAAPLPSYDTSPPHCLSIMTAPWDGLENSRIFIVLSINHAVIDGHSMDVVLREMQLACSNNLKPGSGPSYSNFIALQTRRRAASAEYWNKLLQNATPTKFPGRQAKGGNKRKPRSTPSHVEAVVDFSAGLQAFCRRSGVTISDVSHVAWAVVLGLYTGSRAPVFGYLFSGRQSSELPDVQDAVGVYISMLVARVPLDNRSLSLEDAVKAAHDSLIQDIQHVHCSLADLQHRAGEPLFNTGISVRRTTTDNRQPDKRGPVFFELKESTDPTQYDVSISISIDGNNSVGISMAHWPDAVPRFQVQDALRLFIKVMHGIAHNPSEQVQNLLQRLAIQESEAEAWRKLVPSPSSRSIISFIQEQADVAAAAPAVHSWDGNLTYARLLEESTTLAAQLVSRGVSAGHLVPICFDKSIWNVVAVVGVLMSGAGFVPLDPALPAAVISQRVQAVSARVCITSHSHYNNLSQFTDVVLLPEAIRSGDGSSSPPQLPQSKLESIAYVIFTSGSTGTPKSVAISHGALASSCAARRGPMGFGPESRVLQFASHSFDVSVDEILLTLISGGCVCVPSGGARRDDLAGTIAAMKVNTAMLTSSVTRMLLSGPKNDIGTLQHLIVGGEVASREDIAAWSLCVPRLDIVYGPTECAIASTLLPFVSGPEAAGCLGKPVGCAVWLVDPEDETRLVPDGCTGEILIEGPIIASGYLGDPERTAAAFIQVPPAWAGVKRDSSCPRCLFRTGDLAWRDGAGILHFEGRKDNQLKVNGIRIEPESIEWNIREAWPDPGCQVVVDLLTRGSDGGGVMLAAFTHISSSSSRQESPQELRVVEMTENFGKAAQEVREKLSSLLPAYMIPAIFIPVNYIPVSSSGKTDRRRLKELTPKLAFPGFSPQGADVEGDAETKTETELKVQWAQVLGVPRNTISLSSNFFQVGGDSFTALRLSSAARAAGCNLPVVAIFKHPVLKDMAKAVERSVILDQQERMQAAIETGSTTVKTSQPYPLDRPFDAVFPTTEFQSWCVSCGLVEPRAYMAYFAIHLTGSLNPDRLETAIQRVVSCLPILRTVFLRSRDGDIVQAVLGNSSRCSWVEQVECATDVGFDHAVRELAADNLAQSPFSLGQPLTKFFIVSQRGGNSCLLIRLSHAQYDAFSFRSILEALRSAYSNEPVANVPTLEQFVRASSAKSPDGPPGHRHWRSVLAGAKPTQLLRRAAPIPAFPDRLFSLHVDFVPAGVAAGFTAANVLSAAWALVLARMSACPDILFGLVMSGRGDEDDLQSAAAGPTMSYMPFRAQLQHDWSVRDLIADAQQQLIDGLPFRYGPFFEPRSSIRPREAFSSVLQFQNHQVSKGVYGMGFDLGRGVHAPKGVEAVGNETFLGCADLFVFAEPNEASLLKITFSYASSALPDSIVQRMAEELESCIKSMSDEEALRKPLPDLGKLDAVLPV
ncbi:hypothetical protein EsH8_VII_000987 [Colletotrichum jinshuiense]